MSKSFLLIAAAAALLGGCAMQGQNGSAKSPAAASISFVEFGNIYDWRADGSKGIYIESDDRKWFYATFMSPCTDLPFSEHVGFRSTPPLPLDKFNSIEVRGETCYFQTFDHSPGPPGTQPKPAVVPAK